MDLLIPWIVSRVRRRLELLVTALVALKSMYQVKVVNVVRGHTDDFRGGQVHEIVLEAC